MCNPRNTATLRESFYSLELEREADCRKEPVWVKKLRNILCNDIHQKSLGCHISNTHITVGSGTVHMGSFFEAQILFSHAKWIDRFARWLEEELKEKTKSPCLIVGYETYIEPVLANLKARNSNINYCIYEEPKYTQRDKISKERLRYLEDSLLNKSGNLNSKIKSVVFLCGISSTLSTHEKMKRLFLERIKELNEKSTRKVPLEEEQFSHYTIVQILSTDGDHFELKQNVKLCWAQKHNIVTYCDSSTNKQFTVRYLVDVCAEWQLAKSCKWCFPDNHLQEKPLVTTGETSVIPVQRIGMTLEEGPKSGEGRLSAGESVFFKRNSTGAFSCQDYLYYNHVERGDHHFRFYIRTSKFLDHVLEKKEFSDFCNSIREKLPEKLEDYVHIILAPLHFSNDRFPHEINHRVFDNMAHVISFDPKREYRSNFETKYSNYAYVLEQIKRFNQGISASSSGQEAPKICFYYVDDEIISGNTFFRAKSFVSSLMRKYSDVGLEKANSYEIFSAVITLIDRSSSSSKLNYVNSAENYHSFVHFSIPSLRNYGDACPLCKQIQEAQNISDNCCLNSTAQYWKQKERHLRVRTLDDEREQMKSEAEEIRRRHFVRLYCENMLWENTISLWTEADLISAYLTTISKVFQKLRLKDQYEYLISFIKAFSRPFLHNKEDGKKAALKLLLLFLDGLLDSNPQDAAQLSPDDLVRKCAESCANKQLLSKKLLKISSKSNKPMEPMDPEDYIWERYSLLCILVSCLSAVDSTYLLKSEHIEKLCDHVALLNPEFNRFAQKADVHDKIPGFYTVLVNNFKKLICGVSGHEKSSWADGGLWELLNSTERPERMDLYKVLYLENTQKLAENKALANTIHDITQQSGQNTIAKYQQLSSVLSNAVEKSAICTFYAVYNGQIIELTESIRPLTRGEAFEREAKEALEQLGYYEKGGCFWIIFQPERASDNISRAYLRLRFRQSDVSNFQKVRQLLILRAEILKIIQADMETGALKTAIQAQAAESILLTDKTQSHGQSNDINQLFELVRKQFESSKVSSEGRLSADMYSAYGAINLFMNRCIAFGATKAAMIKYFISDLPSASAIQPFSPLLQSLTEEQAKTVQSDILSYLNILQDKEQKYIEYIKQDLRRKRANAGSELTGAARTIIEVKNPELFQRISHVPFLINISGAKVSAIALIGIIDVFIRNAIEHAGTGCKICISCSMGEDIVPKEGRHPNADYSRSYKISVENNIAPDIAAKRSQTIGFTKLFLTEYLEGLPKQPRCFPRFFSIRMDKPDGRTFCSQLICIAPEVK